MAAKTIKGITVEIDGNATGLGAALKDIEKESSELNSSLKAVNKALELDPTNTELLAEKQKLLASSVEKTSEKLRIMEDVQGQIKKQYADGEIGQAAYIDFQKEIVYTTDKLKRLEKASRNAEEGIDKAGDEAKETSGQFDKMGKTAKDADESSDALGDTLKEGVVSGAKMAAAAVAAVVGALVAAEESTRDYRTEQNKLVTAYGEANFSAETATKTYREMVGILGESDQAVEAANHLAKLTKEEQTLAQWTGSILPGVFSVFGDSLPVENLTEAANLASKTCEISSGLADALEWCGVSTEDFKAQLESCATEQERANLITETLVDLYGDASEAYKNNAADIIEANKANDRLTASTAALGEVVSPLITDVKNLSAGFLESLVPAVSSGVDFIYKAVDEFNEFWPRFLSNTETNYEQTGSYIVDTTQVTADDAFAGFQAGWELIEDLTSGFRGEMEKEFSAMSGFLALDADAKMDYLEGRFAEGWDAVDALTGGKLSGLRDTVDEWMGKARDTISNAINGIKELFNFEWNWPEMSIPGVSVSDVPIGNFGGMDVKWNAEGAILRGAQIFGKLGDTWLGGAEAGDEALLPLSGFYDELERILTRNVSGSSGVVVQVNVEHFENNTDQDLDELSEIVAEKINFNVQREAVFA